MYYSEPIPRIEDLTKAPAEHYCIVNSEDIFEDLQEQIRLAGEIPAVDFDDDIEITQFMDDLYSNIAYLPKAFQPSSIDVVLRDSAEYLACTFSPLQEYLWRKATGELVQRFYHYRMYDNASDMHRYDFDSMLGSNLILKLYGL